MHVYLWLEDGLDKYLVKRYTRPRTQSATSPSDIELGFEVEKNGRMSSSPAETIEAMLPAAASQFFMFHGEEIREISQRHIEQTKKAIELILEAETFRVGRSDLDAVEKEVETERDEILGKVAELRDLVQNKTRMDDNIEVLKGEISGSSTKLKETRQQLDEVETELRTLKTRSEERRVGKECKER